MKRISVFIQLVLIIFLVSVMPIFFMNWHNSKILRENTKGVIAGQAVEKLRSGSRFCDTMLSAAIDFSLDIVLAKEYTPFRHIRSYEELNSNYDYVSAAMRVNQRMRAYCSRNSAVYSAIYYMEDADFLITTDKGICRLKEYEDLAWLGEAGKQIQGAEGVWYPRKSEESGTDLLSYVYRISSLYTANKGMVVVNIKEETVNQMIAEFENHSHGMGALINSQGDVLSSSDPGLLYKNISNISYISQILKTQETEGWDLCQENGIEFLYTYKASELYDWIYINAYEMKPMFAESDEALRREWPLIAGMVLLVSITAVFMAFIISKPIRNLVKDVREADQEYSEDGERKNYNELAYLSQAVGKIKVQERVLKEQLTNREMVARGAVFEKLVYGEGLTEGGKELLAQYFIYPHFIVCLMVIDKFSDYRKKTDHDEREQHRKLMREKIVEVYKEPFVVGIARYSPASIAVILNMAQYDSNQTKKSVNEAAHAIQKYCNKEIGFSLSVGVSTVHSNPENVKECALEAFQAVEKRMLLGEGHVIFYQKQDENNRRFIQGYLYEKRILNYLKTGDIQSIGRELNTLTDEMRDQDNISNDDILLIFNQLTGVLMTWLEDSGCNVSSVFGTQHNLFLELTEKENLEQLKQFMMDICERVIRYRKSLNANESESYCQRAISFINRHYQEDIDFERMAEEAGVSYSYLRKIVKEETGKSLLDHLNLMRVSEAKRLLISTDETVTAIALKIGYHNDQALNRFFKKFEGMSPGEYRESYK